MNKDELKSYIKTQVKEINNLNISDKEKVIEITKDVLIEFKKFDSSELNSEIRKEIFENVKEHKLQFILKQLDFVKKEVKPYCDNNFEFTRMDLMSLHRYLW